jgi:hypothetical protein
MILPTTASATGGLCMPCKKAKLVPAITDEHEEDSITICYTVCPHRGGFSEVYQLTHTSDSSDPILRYQHGSALPHENHPLRVGFHKIFESFDFTEVAVDPPEYQEIVSHVRGLTMPTLAEPCGGFDGTDYGLLVKCLMTKIEYRWWRDLPREWKVGLRPVIAALQRIKEAEQGVAPQSATRSESEGSDKPQPGSKPRPR